MLPLFPLGTVLYPGMVLPLNIFEDRYRRLMSDLLAGPEPRRFGVVAIKEGRETGADGVISLHEIGCVAELQEAEQLDDGRYEIVAVGAERFRFGPLDRTLPYLRAEVELLPDGTGDGDGAAAMAAAVMASAAFRSYLEALAEHGGATITVDELPDEPELLSYLIAAAMIIELPGKQALLAEQDAVRRLLAERALLAREAGVLRATTSRPAPDLRFADYSPN